MGIIADLGRYFLTMFGANGALYNQTAIYQWYTHIPLLIVLIIGSTKLPKQLLRKGWDRAEAYRCDLVPSGTDTICGGKYIYGVGVVLQCGIFGKRIV